MTYRSHGIAADSQRDDIDDTEERGENIDGWKFLSWCFNARNIQRRRTFLLVESYQLAYLAAVSGMKVSWRLAGGGKRQLRGKEAKVSRERKRVREKERKREREKWTEESKIAQRHGCERSDASGEGFRNFYGNLERAKLRWNVIYAKLFGHCTLSGEINGARDKEDKRKEAILMRDSPGRVSPSLSDGWRPGSSSTHTHIPATSTPRNTHTYTLTRVCTHT